jgi:hypothetical protein
MSWEAVAHPGALQAPAFEHTHRGQNATADEALTAESRNAAPDLLARSDTDNRDWWSNELVAAPNPDWVEERACHSDDFSRYADEHLCSPTCLLLQGLSKASSIGMTLLCLT